MQWAKVYTPVEGEIYTLGTASLFLALWATAFFLDVRKRDGVPNVYFSLSTAVYIFAHRMLPPCLHALRLKP